MKENVSPDILLEDPKSVLDEPVPRPDTPRTNEDAQEVTDREVGDELTRDKIRLKIEATKRKRA